MDEFPLIRKLFFDIAPEKKSRSLTWLRQFRACTFPAKRLGKSNTRTDDEILFGSKTDFGQRDKTRRLRNAFCFFEPILTVHPFIHLSLNAGTSTAAMNINQQRMPTFGPKNTLESAIRIVPYARQTKVWDPAQLIDRTSALSCSDGGSCTFHHPSLATRG